MSEPSPEALFGEHMKEAVDAIKPLFKPSATTPEMEKIAEHAANSIWWNVCGHYKDRADFVKQAKPFVDKALAQVRAPLVELLAEIRQWILDEGGIPPTILLDKIAALTGTGESS